MVVIGAGPVGLTTLLIASRCPHVERLVLYEEVSRSTLINRGHQIALDKKTLQFLKDLEVDFDNMEGCVERSIFYTRVGIFLEHTLDMISKLPLPMDIKFDTKVSNISSLSSLYFILSYFLIPFYTFSISHFFLLFLVLV